MAKKYIDLVLDTIESDYSPIGVVKQLDSVIFNITVTENSTIKNLNNQNIKLFAKKPDRTKVEQTEGINTTNSTNGEVTIDLKNSALQAVGLVYFELELKDSEGTISTANFILRVDEKLGSNEAIESTNEFDTFEKIKLEEQKRQEAEKERDKIFKELITEGTEFNGSLENNINLAETLNINLSENINLADSLNTSLGEKIPEANKQVEILNETLNNLNSKNTEATEKIEKLTDLNSEATELANVIIEGLPLSSELIRNAEEAKVINANLQVTNQSASLKKDELETSLAKTEKFIAGLNGSQNIPQIRLDLDELQKSLKTNQSLQYEGSSISVDNTIENRTEGMVVKGQTYKNEMPSLDPENFKFAGKTNLEGDIFTTYQGINVLYDSFISCKLGKTNLKPNTKYSVIVDILENDTNESLAMFTASNFFCPNNSSDHFENKIGRSIVVGTTPAKRESWGDEFTFCIYRSGGDGSKKIKFKAMILEGDWRNKDIPEYFEGIKSFGEAEREGDKYKISILSHNKNFFNINEFSEKINEKGELEFKADGNSRINSYIVIFTENNSLSQKILVAGGNGEKQFTTLNQEEYYIHIGLNGDKKDDKVWRKIVLPRNTTCHISTSSVVVENNNTVRFKDIQIETGTSKSTYEEYKQDKKDILISAPLPGFDFGEDIMYEENGQVKITRNIDTYTFTGDETMRDTTEQDEKSGTGKYKVFALTVNKIIDINKNINNNFPKKNFSVAFQNMDSEGLAVTQYGIYIKILKSKLSTQDTEGLKAWLKANTTTIYFARTAPATEIVENCVDIDLDTYQEKTYFNILNSLPGTLDFRVPSNLGSVVQNMAKEINDIWDVINNLLVPGLMDTKKTLALKTIKNNLK